MPQTLMLFNHAVNHLRNVPVMSAYTEETFCCSYHSLPPS